MKFLQKYVSRRPNKPFIFITIPVLSMTLLLLFQNFSGLNTIVSRHLTRLNSVFAGAWGFDEMTTLGDDAGGSRRGQVSPDGKVWIRYFEASGNVWQIAAVKPLTKGISLDPVTGSINDFNLDSSLGPRLTLGSSSGLINDNSSYPFINFNYGLGGQLAVTFNPAFATKGILMDANNGSCQIDVQPTFSPRDTARFECLHLLIHQRGYYNYPPQNPICQYTPAPDYGLPSLPCMMMAPLVVLLDRGDLNNPYREPAIIYARLGKFRPMQFKFPDGRQIAMRQKINEYAATSDSGLVFFIHEQANYALNPHPEIAYTFNTRPYLRMAESPDWVSTGWTFSRSLWGLYDDSVSNGPLSNVSVRGLGNGFRKAYPMAQYPFRFSNGVRLRRGLGRYQWFSPEGGEMILNIGARSIATMLGRETRGVMKHLDTPAQLTRTVYCTGLPDTQQICDPAIGKFGNIACTGSNQCGNGSIIGIQEYTSPGSATGFWAAPFTDNDFESATPAFPFNRRVPLRYLLVNNKALALFNPRLDLRGRQMWMFTEVANDDYNDPNFLAFFHMNEALFNKKGPTDCDFGASTYCDIGPLRAFNNVDDRNLPYLIDTSSNSYLGRPSNKNGGTPAKFPFDYWKELGVGERIQGNSEGTGEVNPGYLGRAVHFDSTSFVDIRRNTNPEGNITKEKAAFTVEAAIRLAASLNREYQPTQAIAVTSANYDGLVARQKKSWSFGFEAGRLTFRATMPDQSEAFVQATSPITLSSQDWTHIVATVGFNDPSDNSLSVNLYINGVKAKSGVLKSGAIPIEKLRAVTAAEPELFCMGPGCGAASSTPVWLDEIALSDIARSPYYISAAANRTQGVPGIGAYRSKMEWPPLVGEDTLIGLSKNDLRVPVKLLDLIGGDKTKFRRLVNLGRALFHDPILSSYKVDKHNSRSCSSCHAESRGFASPTNEKLDAALGGGTLRVNTPTILNRLFSIRQFLDTRSSDILDQATGPITNPLEMGSDLEIIMDLINNSTWSPGRTSAFINVPPDKPLIPPTGIRTYKRWFCLAFTNTPDCSVVFTKNELKQALAIYELTLTRTNTPVDQMKLGLPYQDSISRNGYVTSLSEGYRIFQGKGRCIGCHSSSNFSDELLHQSGPLFDNKPLRVKTPTLRGLAMTFPYFHDGSNGNGPVPSWCQFKKGDSERAGQGLCQVVEFYNTGACRMTDTVYVRSYQSINDTGSLAPMQVDDISCDPESVSLGLSGQEKRNLVEFLLNL